MNVANFRRPYAVLTLDGLDPVDTSISEQALLLDGMNVMGANVQVGGFRVVQMADAVDQSDAVSLKQLDYVSGAVTAAVADLSGQIDAVEVTVGTVQTTLAAVQSTVNNIGLAVFDMNGNNIIEVGVGATGSSDAANVAQMEAAIAQVVTAYTLADSQVIAAFAAADVNLTNARIAGDALKVSKAGDTMTGSLVINEASLPSYLTLVNGNTSTILFRDATLAAKAGITYYNTSTLLQFDVGGIVPLGLSSTKCTSYVPLEMSSKKITGLLAGAAASTDAANVSQVEAADTVVTNAFTAADNLRVRHDGSTAMTGSLNMNSNSVNNVVNVRSPTATDLVLGRTGTGTEIQIKATEILIGKNITMSGANINMGTGYIGLQAGVNPTDAVNKGQLDTKTYLKTASTSNGSLTIADPSSFLTTVTFRNEYTLFGSPYGTCYFITEALAQVWIKANVTTHAKESGIQLDAATFIFFTGDVASPTVRFNYDASSTNEMNVYGRLNMRSNKITGVTAGASGTTEAVNTTQMEAADNAVTSAYIAADALKLSLAGGTMTGAINMGTKQITNLANATGAQNAVTMTQTLLRNGTQAMTGDLDMGVKSITNVYAINSSSTTPIYVTNNNVAVAQFDSNGLAISASKSINMTGNNIKFLGNSVAAGDAVNRNEIAESLIPITRWRSGETISRYYISPALGDNLVTNPSTVAGGANIMLLNTGLFYATAIGNRLLFKFGCECNAPNSGTDNFDIVLELGPTPTIQTFRYVLGPSTGYRTRSLLIETMYIAQNVGSISVTIRIYNYGNDTITTNQSNFHFSAEEIKA